MTAPAEDELRPAVIDREPGLGERAAGLRQRMADRRLELRACTRAHGEDHPEVAEWRWSPARRVGA